MAAEDFADDTKDGGEIGAGHQVTALFEIILADSDFEIQKVESKYSKDNDAEFDPIGEYLTVNVRYKEPDGDESTLLEYPVTDKNIMEEMSDNMSWAAGVAQVAMILKDSEYKGTSAIADVRERLRPIASDDFREEFVYLIRKIAD